jgi:hypothetical protein
MRIVRKRWRHGRSAARSKRRAPKLPNRGRALLSSHRLAYALLGAVGPLVAPAGADAQSLHYWYLPYGSYNLVNQNTTPGSPAYWWNSVEAGYLPSHLLGPSPGGVLADRAASGPNEYCNYYGISPLEQTTSSQIGNATGFYPPTPASNYQYFDRVASGCQAYQSQWGEFIDRTDPNYRNPNYNVGKPNCDMDAGSVCGIHHTVAFKGTNDYPWSTAFGSGPELTLKSDFKVNRYNANWTGYVISWAYTCAVLRSDQSGRDIEMCFNKWQPPESGDTPSSGYPYEPQSSPLVGNCGGDLVTAWTAFPTRHNPAWATNTGPQGTVKSGAMGAWTFQATITKGNLKNLINYMNSAPGCAGGWSTDPSQYKLVALEDGIESTGPNSPLQNFGASGALAAWTAY